MKIARLYITLALVIFVSCEEPSKSDEAPSLEAENPIDDVPKVEEVTQYDEDNDTMKIAPKNIQGHNDEQLPILPPIILLDFADDPENSSSTSGDEKSKRTIDGNLGYGFGRNNLFTGKYNYYFPAGKTGTSVSIEESVSPFLPKTIIETVKPITEKNIGDSNSGYGQNPLIKNSNSHQSASRLPQPNSRTFQSLNNRYQQQLVFGQRTKLYKPSQIDYASYQYTSTPKSVAETTIRTDYHADSSSSNLNSYATVRPNFQRNSFGNGYSQGQTLRQSYVTPTAPSYHLTSDPRHYEAVTTVRPMVNDYRAESPLASFANLPRYTIENGVRYENKIVWKYPNGKISQTPPASYLTAYNEFLVKQKPGIDISAPNYESSVHYQSPGSASASYQAIGSGAYQSMTSGSVSSYQNQNYQPNNRYQSADSFGNIHSKSPAQFPKDQDNVRRPPSQFVSSASLASGNFGPGSALSQQSYENPYQGQYGQKTYPRDGSSSQPNSAYQSQQEDSHDSLRYDDKQRPISKYAVNSPNADYTYSTDSPMKSTTSTSLFTASGKLSPEILSKYSTQAQKYLTKVFANDETSNRPMTTSSETYDPTTNSYGSENYENLLNYNPSIAQYIRNPSSILNARPTFIQAGNSLIPVIILRVDGATPLRPKVTPNINLKALLQQYLTQYAGSLSQNANYDIGNQISKYSAPNGQQNPVYELAQLAQSLTQYSNDPSIADRYSKQLDNFDPYPTRTSYDDRVNNSQDSSNNYNGKTSKQKVKSVQIIEDPRFPSYKVNS